jgi:ParB/Sulfiredoxin domain
MDRKEARRMMKVHPLAEMMPKMNSEEFEALKHSIRTQGLKRRILTYRSVIIDGRNRFWACNELGIEPQFEELQADLSEEQIMEMILLLNVPRRHLTISQRAAIGAKLIRHYEADAEQRRRNPFDAMSRPDDCGRSRDHAARSLAVNQRYIQAAKKLMDEYPELYQQVFNGAVTLSDAFRVVNSKSKPASRPPVPRLALPAEAQNAICCWGTTEFLDSVREFLLERAVSHVIAHVSNGKWITDQIQCATN